MLEQFNYYSVRRADICKASTDELPRLCKDPGATLASRFDGFVYVVDMEAEMSNAIPMLKDTVSVDSGNCRFGVPGIGREDQRQSTEAQEISDAAVGALRLTKHPGFEDIDIIAQAGIRI